MSFGRLKNRKVVGNTAVIVSAVIYGLSPMLARFCLNTGMNQVTLEFLVSILAVPLLAVAALKTEHTLKIPRGEGKALILLGALITATNLLLLCAYLWIPTGTATALHFLYPVLVVLLSWLLFGEKVGRRIIAGLGACLAGTGFLLSENLGGNMLGIGCALLSALAYSFYIVILSQKIRTTRALVMVFYLMAVQLVICERLP